MAIAIAPSSSPLASLGRVTHPDHLPGVSRRVTVAVAPLGTAVTVASSAGLEAIVSIGNRNAPGRHTAAGCAYGFVWTYVTNPRALCLAAQLTIVT